MSDICPECYSTIQPDYRGACVTCLRREHARIRADLATLTRERDEARRDRDTLAAEVWARRDRDTLAAEVWAWREHHADRPGMEVMAAMRDGCRTYEVLRKARAATDATGALNRAGGGA